LCGEGLDPSASFAIDSVLDQVAGGGADAGHLAIAPTCDLLASCLSQAAHPSARLADALRRLLAARATAAAAILVERCVASPACAALSSSTSSALDSVCTQLCDSADLGCDPAAAQLAELLLVGDGAHSLAAAAGQAGALRALHARVVAEGGDDPAALKLALRVVASPALSTSPSVLQLRLSLVASTFGVWLTEAYAATAGTQAASASGRAAADSDVEQEHSELYG
jgi:hypothetical protein